MYSWRNITKSCIYTWFSLVLCLSFLQVSVGSDANMKYCVYDTDIATGLGVGSLLFLMVSQLMIMGVTRCLCCGRSLQPGRSRVWAIVFFISCWYSINLLFFYQFKKHTPPILDAGWRSSLLRYAYLLAQWKMLTTPSTGPTSRKLLLRVTRWGRECLEPGQPS